MGRSGSLVIAGAIDAIGKRIRSTHWSYDLANGTEASRLCLEKDSLQFKKKRDPERFGQAQYEIADLINQARTGQIELAYVDEAGFALQPPNRSAWTKRGETHAVTARRSQRLNVIGALFSSGRLMMTKLWEV